MKFNRLLGSLALAAATASVLAAEVDVSKLPPASKQAGVTFDKDIKPVFEKSCFKCHGTEKQKGKLRLDSLDAALKGGENAPDIIVKDSAKSPLVWAVARIGDEDDAMPPKGKGDPLTTEQIALIRAWIDQGAK
ncbi:MAG TPA: c-type cytochrome domain-containing protein [Candidatus Limnocylindria bacterium]|jgi:mono/diheme cytochrome c family protein|nr:c-type cytochrome domain-containing protein [Candidatus Limnocylindria bacterium]